MTDLLPSTAADIEHMASELQALRAELAARNSEFSERIEYQAATIEVLKAMSASPGDAQPVFDLIARQAAKLCIVPTAAVATFDGTMLHLATQSGFDAAYADAYVARFPRPVGLDSSMGRAILHRRVDQVEDITTDPGHSFVDVLGHWSVMAVPMLRDGAALGAIAIGRPAAGPFSDSQVALLQTFAEQAVIAISSAETYRELEVRTTALAARNSEYGERIEQQAATIDVLKVMSASPGNAQPVFELIAERARAFCEADGVAVALLDGDRLHLRTHRGYADSSPQAFEARFPLVVNTTTILGRTMLAREAVQVPDVRADHGHVASERPAVDMRSVVGVPMLRAGTPIGAIALGRRVPGDFTATQVELLRTFAEQAVIAIGSAETYSELQERTAALATRNNEYGERIEQQAATIDVLKVMSASPGDAQPVFRLIVERARAFCEADGATLALLAGDMLHLQAFSGFLNREYEAGFPRPVSRATMFGRAILARDVVQAPDVSVDPDHYTRDTGQRATGGTASSSDAEWQFRAIIAVPLLRAGTPIGAIAIGRRRPGEFSATEVELLKTFAEQAVIAITSAETYRELQERTAALAARNSEYGERIEQQAATIDVLKVMSASPGDARPVFELIVERARSFCSADQATTALVREDMLHLQAYSGMSAAYGVVYAAQFPRPVDTSTMFGRAILSRDVMQTGNVQADRAFLARQVQAADFHSIVGVPLLREGTPIGAIALGRHASGGFTDSQVALLQTFAEQAVIAVSSAETYRELEARTAALAQRNSEFGERIQQQSATIDVLKVMSASPDDTRPVFDLITRRAQELCSSSAAGIYEFDGEFVHFSSIGGGLRGTDFAKYRDAFPMVPTRGSIPCRAILDRQIIHIRDTDADSDLLPVVRALDVKSMLAIPLLRDDIAIGAFAINSVDRGGFTDSQVALLRTFAEQAVIAITSVSNFRTLRERTAELTRSVAELQALEEVLRAVNSSLDLETVLVTIISRAVQLSLSDEGTIYEYDAADQVFVPKSAFGMSPERVALLRDRRIRLGETHLGRSAMLRAPVAVDDVQQDPEIPDAAETLPGIHAVLAVPLLRDETVVGGLVIRRRTEDSFAPHLVTLMQTFAGQAVLAIENARLFQEAGRARAAAETALVDLRRAQDRLVQSEKMASLGQLTAGIAHEIKNPLNFVNNFSELSSDLLDELNAAVAPDRLAVAADLRTEIDDLTATLKGNLEKIVQHGRRADSIVKNMLLHSRSGPSEHRAIDLNATVEEALNLAYHGARAETPGFNITMKKDLDPAAGMVDLYPQEFIRVMLNLINNGFYAARTRADQGAEPDFEPTLWLVTRNLGEQVEIRVRDNGTGISEAVRGKIFEPFFTTKPAGEGTGLGLSLSYDIVVKQHGGRLTVDSRNDAFTEFQIILPRAMAATDGGQS